MDTSISNEAKKINLEELSREELLKKCKGLLTIAQKAKQAKDSLQEENIKLKHELAHKSKNDVSEELLENFTQQKLSLVTTIEDLKARNTALDSKLQIFEKELKTCQEKLDTTDNENISYKRQVTRLTDENEQLLMHLDSLEKQIEELNKFGIQQRQQLLELESKARDYKNVIDENKVTELQCMLSVTLEEVKKLKSENGSLNEKIENLSMSLTEKNKNILLISEELKSKCDIVDKVTQELNELQSNKETRNDLLEDYEKLKARCKELTDINELFKSNAESNENLEKRIDELQCSNDKLKEKLKLYHSKIVKFAGNTKALKEEKNTVLQLFKQYTDQVKEWKEQLNTAANSLVEKVNKVQSENRKLKEDIISLKQEDNKHSEANLKKGFDESTAKYESQIEDLKRIIEDSKQTISEYKHQIETLIAQNELINNELTSQKNQCSQLLVEIAAIKEENSRLTDELNVSELKYLESTKKIQNLLNSNTELKNEVEILQSEKKSINIVFKEKDATYKKQLEEYQHKLLENEKLVTELKDQRKKCDDDIEHIEKIEKKLKEENARLTNELKQCELKFLESTKETQNLLKSISELKNEIDILKNEKESINSIIKEKDDTYKKQSEEYQHKSLEYEELVTQLKEQRKKYEDDMEHIETIEKNLKEENARLANELKECELKYLESTKETQNLLQSNSELKNEIEILKNEKESINNVIKEKDTTYKKQLEEYQNKLSENEKLVTKLQAQKKKYEDDREHIEVTEKKLAEISSEEIIKLVDENKELSELNNTLQENLKELQSKQLNISHSGTQTGDDLPPTNELEEQIMNLKRENTELLSEMNEMNQALKERGENISKLEAHCEEVMKKLQIYETQANKNVDSISQKEELIKSLTEEINLLRKNENNDETDNSDSNIKDEEITRLKGEIENLKERLNANLETSYAESETMSTSTVSRTEDINRLRDLEGSWEERYGKLRNLAIKLKGKIRELSNTLTKEQSEKEDLQKKISANLKTIQTLQNQSDKLEDELENSRQESKQYLNRLNTIAEDISKDKQSLVEQDDTISQLKKEIETLKIEKQSTENWKKQVSAKVQTLRKELEANNVLKKDFESKIVKLTEDLDAKDQALKAEIESHKQTRSLLDASNHECKKNSVLSLEMQDYERSVKETAKKLEKQQEEVKKWKGQVESQKSTINALREQNKMLEERVQEIEENLNSATTEIGTHKKKISQLEEEIEQKEEKIQSVNQLLETSRSETEELSTELSKVIAEHQKTNGILKTERDLLRSQTLGLQQNLREVQDALKLKEDELVVIRDEYEGYKVRAQSVLRQNQSRDVGLEERLAEDLASLKAQNSQLTSELEKMAERIKLLEEANEKLTTEKEEGLKKLQEMESDIEELKTQYAQLSAKHQTALNEHAETVRSLKLHADTLSQCYRQQITEQETRHNREIIELQSRFEKTSSPVETPPVPPTMPREEGEGSESIESNNPPKIYPVPLERLLGSDSDQELGQLKKQLAEQESRLLHLTELLSDTEQDLAKHVQMNKLLKEEIRRQQRSEEREKHAENLEYLKNVVFKFVTLHSGDERSRLVPVLNTILKLSPEESQKLNIVARGESAMKGWTNYLPTWPSPNKP